MKLAALFNTVIRELMELSYLDDQSVILDGSKLRKTLPDFSETLLPKAIRLTLKSYQKMRGSSPPD